MTEQEKKRKRYIDICKRTALGYLDSGRPVAAVHAMLADLEKHKETRDVVNDLIFTMGVEIAKTGDPVQAREFIEGFN